RERRRWLSFDSKKEDRMKQILCLSLLLFIIQGAAYSTYLDDAKALLNEKKPEEALILLEKALAEDPTNEEVYLNLGFTYDLLKKPAKSLEIVNQGLVYAGKLKYLFYFNMGNTLFTLGKNKESVDMFTKSIEINSRFAEAYLNRANGTLKLSYGIDNINDKMKSYEIIIKDCETYLVLKPSAPQRAKVEELIAKLRGKIRDKDKREQDLQNLLDILNSTTDSTKDITAGAEDIDVDYEDEDILD
ncbi:MAG: hypothetical protein JXJ04_03080, partial [Spirochaetales bacterium]|nr:hypothetical protein [Spirochaetales bacterium]